MQDLALLLPLIGIPVLFWLFLVRPAAGRQKALRGLQDALQVGDRVMLAAGLYGTIRSVDGDRIGLEVAEGVVVSAARGAVVEVLGPERSS